MKHYLISTRYVIPSCTVLIVIFIWVGFRFFTDGFSANLVAESCGVILGIITTLIIVENVIRAERKREVETTIKFTLWSTSHEIYSIINKFGIIFSLPGVEVLTASIGVDASFRKGEVSEDTLRLFSNFLKATEIRKADLVRQINKTHIINFYEATDPNMRTISDVLIPRVIQFSHDNNLIDILITYEQIIALVKNDFPLFKQGNTSLSGMFNHTLAMLNSGYRVLESIHKRIEGVRKEVVRQVTAYEATKNIYESRMSGIDKIFDKIFRDYENALEKLKRDNVYSKTYEGRIAIIRINGLIKSYFDKVEANIALETKEWNDRTLKLSSPILTPSYILKHTEILENIRGIKTNIEAYRNDCLSLNDLRKELLSKLISYKQIDEHLDEGINLMELAVNKLTEFNRSKIQDIDKLLTLIDIRIHNKGDAPLF